MVKILLRSSRHLRLLTQADWHRGTAAISCAPALKCHYGTLDVDPLDKDISQFAVDRADI